MTSSVEKAGTPPGLTPEWRVGKLEVYSETGTEGGIWALYEDGRVGYDALHCLENGDTLQVWERDTGRQVFYGKIRFDWRIGNRLLTDFHPTAVKGIRQQMALGMWIHGIQEGFDPDEWALLFVRPDPALALRAAVLPRGKRGMVKEQPQKASPTRWRSKRASKMARSAGKSRSVSGRRGSGRSSKP